MRCYHEQMRLTCGSTPLPAPRMAWTLPNPSAVSRHGSCRYALLDYDRGMADDLLGRVDELHGQEVIRRWPRLQRTRAAAPGASPGPEQQPQPISAADVPDWLNSLNRHNIQGPGGPPPTEQSELPVGPSLMGERGYRQWQEIKQSERQRVWDSIRESAAERYARGEMPDWFDPRWLAQEESPMNQILREMGDPAYQRDDTWLGRPYDALDNQPQPEAGGGGWDGSDGNDNGGRGRSSGGSGFWRPDDPYWMLRDWGSHPMRWWTLGFAALLALGGVGSYVFHGTAEGLFVGTGAAGWLVLCSLAMSDMRSDVSGELGVKAAWAACALLALKDGIWGWAHVPGSGMHGYDYGRPSAFAAAQREPAPWDWLLLRVPALNLGGCGWAAVSMCAMYMFTGMGGELDGSLPINPGAVYKSGDIVMKHRVWKRWGYGDEVMRV